jgi:hypothetical protein
MGAEGPLDPVVAVALLFREMAGRSPPLNGVEFLSLRCGPAQGGALMNRP